VILISHRGNIEGRRPELENTPAYIDAARTAGYEVEIDVWHEGGTGAEAGGFFLGHDRAERAVTLEYLSVPGLWLHAKNIAALLHLRQAGLHCFFHDSDGATLTSRGYIWTFPGQPLTPLSICVLPERPDGHFAPCAGVCSDVIARYRV
jgi:hypothetical protein